MTQNDVTTYPFDNPPFTWQFNGAIQEKLHHALDRAAQLDGSVDYSKLKHFKSKPVYWAFGAEMEFMIETALARVPAQYFESNRERIRGILNSSLQSAHTAPDRQAIEAQIADLPNYTLRDMMMFDIHEKLDGRIHKKRSRQIRSAGYYDNEGVSEIQINPGPADDVIAAYGDAVNVIKETADSYKAALPIGLRNLSKVEVEFRSGHLNFSPNIIEDTAYERALRAEAKDVNAMVRKAFKDKKLAGVASMKTPETMEYMQHALAGIVQAEEDAQLLMPRNHYLKELEKIGPFSAGLSRFDHFRLAKDRAEYRMMGADAHMANVMLRIVGGTEYGLSHSLEELKDGGAPEFQVIKAANFTSPPATAEEPMGVAFEIRKVMQNSRIDRNGHLHPDMRYIRKYRSDIIEDIMGFNPPSVPKMTDRFLEKMFSQIRITPAGSIDLSEVEPWLKAHLDKPYNEPSIKHAMARLPLVKWVETFDSLQIQGQDITVGRPVWYELLDRLEKSPVIQHIYDGRNDNIDILSPMADGLQLIVPGRDVLRAKLKLLRDLLYNSRSLKGPPNISAEETLREIKREAEPLAKRTGMSTYEVLSVAYDALDLENDIAEWTEEIVGNPRAASYLGNKLNIAVALSDKIKEEMAENIPTNMPPQSNRLKPRGSGNGPMAPRGR